MWRRISNSPLFYPVCLILLWLISIWLIRPFGEFPVNDDWAYSRNVFNLVARKRFVLDTWPAMTLISQTLWGALFTWIFGFSFTILKCSILVLAVTGSLALYSLILMLSRQRFLAFLLSGLFCFNPLFLALSFTYMTDVFFVVFLLLSFRSAFLYMVSGKLMHLIFFSLFCLIATLDRQYGLLSPVVFIPAFLWREKISRTSVIASLMPLCISLAGHYGYRLFLKLSHIPSNMSGMSKISSFLSEFKAEQSISKAVDMILVIGLIAFPCALWLIVEKKRSLKAILFFLAILAMSGLLIGFYGHAFPNGNIFTRFGIGPKLLKDLEWREHLKFGISGLWLCALKIMAAISVSIFLFSLRGRNVFLKKAGNPETYFYFSLLFYLVAYFIFSVTNANYFDRYTLPMLLAVILLLVPVMGTGLLHQRVFTAIYLGVFVAMTFFLVKDYYSWQQTRWGAIRYLEAQGPDAHRIDGGFEYNGWHQPGPFAATGNTENAKSWWWIDKDDFVIANGPMSGYRIQKGFVYQHYLPYEKDTVYILEKQAITNPPQP